MPIYEYSCLNCGHQLEKLQKVSDAPLTLCPACNQNTLQKTVSAAGFRLRGGGWYETDFKNKSDTKRNLADSGEALKPSSSAQSAESSQTKASSSSETSK